MDLKTRSHNWKTVKRQGITLLWEPFMVDLAISYPGKIKNVSELVMDGDFLKSVAAAASQIRSYEGYRWSPEDVSSDTAKAYFFFQFLRRTAPQVAMKSGIYAPSAPAYDEICSIVLEKIAEAVHSFKPGFRRSGVEKSWGFEAYLRNYSVKTACQDVKKAFSNPTPPRKKNVRCVSVDASDLSPEFGNMSALEKMYSESFSSAPLVPRRLGENDCARMVTEAVRESLGGTPEGEVYFWHAIEGKTIRETSKILSISRGKCHRLAERAAEKVWTTIDTKLRVLGIA